MNVNLPGLIQNCIGNYLPDDPHAQEKVLDHFKNVKKEELSDALIDPQGSARSCLAQHVKAEQITPVMEACKKLFGAVVQNLHLMTGGRGTSKIFKFTVNEKDYVLRVTDKHRPAFYIDTMSEINNMKRVNNLDVAPKVYHADPESCVIIMDYIPNVRLTPTMLEDEQQADKIYKELANSLRRLHSCPRFTEEPTNIFRDTEKLVQEAETTRMPPIALKALDAIRPLEDVLKKFQKDAPCHKDLHSNNILYSGEKIYFIDWELGANCDPFMDLGFISMFYIFEPAKEEAFLKHYFQGEPTAQQKAHFFLMKQTCLTSYAMRLLRRVTGINKMDLSKEHMDKTSLPNYRDFILENFNGNSKSFTVDNLKVFAFVFLTEAMRNIETPQFRQAIEVLKQNQ